MNRRSRLAAYNTIFGARPLTASYVGPFDGITFAALYGLKRFLTAYTGPLIRLRRNSDNAEDDFYPVSDTGLVDQEAIDDFLGVASPFMPTWYDQSGNGRNATQVTTSYQPTYVASAVNGLPALSLDGANDNFVYTFSPGLTNPLTWVDAHKASTVASGYRPLVDRSGGSGFPYCGLRNAGGYIDFHGIANTTVATDTNPHVWSAVWNGASSSLYEDGGAAKITGNTGTVTLAAFRYGSNAAVNASYSGYVMAGMWLANAISVADHNAIGNELGTLYNITWNTVS